MLSEPLFCLGFRGGSIAFRGLRLPCSREFKRVNLLLSGKAQKFPREAASRGIPLATALCSILSIQSRIWDFLYIIGNIGGFLWVRGKLNLSIATRTKCSRATGNTKITMLGLSVETWNLN